MFRGVMVVLLGVVVVVLVVAMVKIGGEPAALAQQGQAAGPPAGEAKAQPPKEQKQTPAASQEDRKALARAAEEWVKNNPKGKSEAAEKPVPKDNAFPEVKREEREAMGLPAPRWVAKYGKVQPAVREALEEQKRLIAMPDSMAEFQTDRPGGFQGTAYVDIYLRHHAKGAQDSTENQAAIKEMEDRLLDKLTAWEFRTIFVFTKTAGLAGYIDEAGLAKLAKDPDVVAVGLDDQASPERPPIALRDEGRTHLLRDRKGKVDPEVYEKLKESTDGYVYVMVNIPYGNRREMSPDDREAQVWQIHTRILSSLSAADFKLWDQGFTGGFDGWVNAAGLAKLERHPDVDGVGLTTFVEPAGSQ